MGVPFWNTGFPSLNDATQEQKEFYRIWIESIKNKPLDLEGNLGYVFVYLYKVIDQDDVDSILEELKRVLNFYGEYPAVKTYCTMWIADCYVLKGVYDLAYKFAPNDTTIRIASGNCPTLKETIWKTTLNVTDYGKNHLEEISSELEASLTEYQKSNDIDIIESCLISMRERYSFTGGMTHRKTGLTSYRFDTNKFKELISGFTLECENKVRVKYGMPKVGEGWISETELYYEVKHAFPKYQVVQHGRPSFLGKQHLDVYIPELMLGIEYQGKQHTAPVNIFGGEAGFAKIVELDTRKREVCEKNNLELIYVYDDYTLDSLIQKIVDSCCRRNIEIEEPNLQRPGEQVYITGYSRLSSEKKEPHIKGNGLEVDVTKRSNMSEKEVKNYENLHLSQLEKPDSIIDKHDAYSWLIRLYYTYRDYEGFLDKCIETCLKDIAITEECIRHLKTKISYYAQSKEFERLSDSFKRLGIIYEKVGQLDKSIEIAEEAIKHGFGAYFEKRVKLLNQRISKQQKKLQLNRLDGKE
jgi:hypothetical protein